MKNLKVEIEMNGEFVHVGNIVGNQQDDARFTYSKQYLNQKDAKAISLSLPLNNKNFTPNQTRNFFDGLLPEGFIRRSVAEELQVDVNDYLSILENLGSECIGAIRITSEDTKYAEPHFKKLTNQEIAELAKEGATASAKLVTKAHLSLTGASGKVGLYHDSESDEWYLPIGLSPSNYIVKQSHIRLKKIVTNEQLCLLTAQKLGIQIPESSIITSNGNNEEVLFTTKRYDRKITDQSKIIDGLKVPYRLHQEDFAQALGISSMKKYEKENEDYFLKCIELIRHNFTNSLEDTYKFWSLTIFNYLIGNTDNHIKNVSLLYGEDLTKIQLAPAYDIVCTMLYENSSEEMAFYIGGENNIKRITRNHFEIESKKDGLVPTMAMNSFDKMVNQFKEALEQSVKELTNVGYEDAREIGDLILKTGGIKNYLK